MPAEGFNRNKPYENGFAKELKRCLQNLSLIQVFIKTFDSVY